MRILIIKLSAIGDATHTLPALAALRRQEPGAQITWLAEAPAAEVVRGHPALDRLLVWPRREWRRLLRTGRWLRLAGEVRAFVRQLRDTRYDLVIDFQGLLKSAVWVALARGDRKAGYGPGQRHDERAWIVLNERVPVTDPGAHAVERNLRLLEGLGFSRGPLAYDFPIPAESEQQAERLLDECGLPPGTPFVAANTMTRWETKNWTPEGFAAVADGLGARGLPVVFTGAPGDRAALDAIAAVMRTPMLRVDGRTSLQTLAALYRRARVVISTDTGPMHIAVAAGTRVVALFGPTSADYTGPHGEEHVVLRAPGVDCSPCFRRVCTTTRYEKHACMRRLSPEAVIDAVAARVGRG